MKETRGGLLDALVLLTLLDPPVVDPPVPEMFEDVTGAAVVAVGCPA